MDVPVWGTIVDQFSASKEKIASVERLNYSVENGVNVSGQFVNDWGRPEKTMLQFMQVKPRNMTMANTDENGRFLLSDLQFYDTTTFMVKAANAKDQPYGKVSLLSQEFAAMDWPHIEYKIVLKQANSVERIITDYEKPKDAIMLKNIEVKAKKLETPIDRVKRSYGQADFVLSAKDINASYGNLLYALPGKVAGLIVQPSTKTIYFQRALYNSFTHSAAPLVTINNVPMSGEAGDVLSMIDPATVESIEFTKRVNVLYGSLGASGVIAVYTKEGVSGLNVPSNFQQLKVSGYSRSNKFLSPNYGDISIKQSADVDYRSTIYWNPEVILDSKTGIANTFFYASDLTGHYHVVVEGVTATGAPLKSECFIIIQEQ